MILSQGERCTIFFTELTNRLLGLEAKIPQPSLRFHLQGRKVS